MHELAVTQNILDLALKHAGGQQITGLYLTIGQLTSIVDDSVQFYWDAIAQGTLAEGAKLHFKRVPTELLCRDCQHQFKPINDNFTCPLCGSFHVKIIAGEEFYMEAIEVETPRNEQK